MLADLSIAISSLKTAGELAALILNTKVDSVVRQKAIELQSDIISLQSGLLNLQLEYQESLRERDSLKQQLMKAKNWKNEARKYSLKEIASGVFVYAIKQDKQGTQPMHWLCTNCLCTGQKLSNLAKRNLLETIREIA